MIRRSFLVGSICLLAAVAAPGLAQASFGFAPGGASFQILDPAGNPDGRAGAHPDRVDIQFAFNAVGEAVDGNVRDITVELPPGLVGDPSAVPTCPREIFDSGLEEKECPAESQVGVATLTQPSLEEQTVKIFNVQPAPGQLAELGEAQIVKLPLEMKLAPGDFRAVLEQRNISQAIPVMAIKTELWGVPADHQGTGLARGAFLTTPTRCDGKPLGITIRARSWQEPDVWHAVAVDTGTPPTGCGALAFEPNVDLTLSNPKQDEPTGLRADISSPSKDDPSGTASSSVESVSIALPEGMSVSPGGLEAVAVCTDDRFGLGSDRAPDCPVASRVGTVEIAASPLRAPLAGDVFLGAEQPGGRFRLLVGAEGPGVAFKLAGELRPDPQSGRLSVVLGSLPQIPFSRIGLQLFGGPRALLATPLACGPATANSTLSPYSGGPAVQLSDSTDVVRIDGGGCPGEAPFAPQFSARTSQLKAGGSTTLAMSLRRRPGEQLLNDFEVELPRGFSAALGSVGRCASADAALASCPAASRIGSVVAEVGSGPEPAVLDGDSYLTGPYHGAPFGIAIVLRGVIGPFDLGTFVVRGTVSSLPLSGRLAIATDSLPRTVRGVSVRLRSMTLDIDRSGFIRNPTSCAPASAAATIRSAAGLRAQATSPLVVRGCNSLRFRPAISVALTGADQVGRGGKPGFSLALRMPPRSTNLRGVSLPLPSGLGVDASGLRELCARGEAIAGRCPAGAEVGTAIARSPLLREPLDGAVYAVQPHGNGLPDLWTSLESGGLRVEVRGKTFSKHGRLNAQLVGIPDIPLSSFRMRLAAGRGGLFVLDRRLCGGAGERLASTVGLEGQNRAYRFARVAFRHPSCNPAGRRGARRG